MRKLLFVVVSVAAMVGALGASAQAAPEPTSPSGSTFDGQDVHCGHSTHKPLGGPVLVRNDYTGAEVCSDSLGPVQGRVILKSNWDKPGSGPVYLPDYLHVDGDKDNPVAPGHVTYINLPG